MASTQMKSIAALLLFLNFCMYAIILGIGGWAMNHAIDHGFIIGNIPCPSLISILIFYELVYVHHITTHLGLQLLSVEETSRILNLR